MQEIWKDIPGYKGYYQVSNMGRIKSIFNKRHGFFIDKILLGTLKKGYIFCTLRIYGKEKHISISRTVAAGFIENPFSKPEVNHINGIKTDNRVENLEWVTRSENIRHSFKFLLRATGDKKIKSISINGEEFVYKSIREASRQLSIDHSSIIQVLKGRRAKAGEYRFEYL